MLIEKLDWDSAFFGYEIGKVEVTSNFNAREFLKECPKSKYKVIYLFSEVELPDLKSCLVDEKILLKRNLNEIDGFPNPSNNIISYIYGNNTFPELRKLAIESGKYSRFNIDPKFSKVEFERLYTEWIRKSVENLKAFDCLIYCKDDVIMGLTTIEKKTDQLADIGLVAVHSDARGQGIGRSLVMKSLEKAKNAGFSEVQVVTQKANRPAMGLYRKCGFQIKKINYVYHFWNT